MFRSFTAVLFLTVFSFTFTFAQTNPSPSPASDPVPASVSPDPAPTYTRPSANARFKRYVKSTVGPFTLARNVAYAGLATWENSPEEWGGQWEGFGKRVASNFGKNLIKQTTIYGLDEALKLDSGYYRATGKSNGAKIRNALISPVTSRTRSGKRVIGIPRIVGAYSGNIIARETWSPDRYDWKDGVRNGTISFAVAGAFNLFKEFVWKK